jgi:two-component system nitrate/nitrite response regulator NarL
MDAGHGAVGDAWASLPDLYDHLCTDRVDAFGVRVAWRHTRNFCRFRIPSSWADTPANSVGLIGKPSAHAFPYVNTSTLITCLVEQAGVGPLVALSFPSPWCSMKLIIGDEQLMFSEAVSHLLHKRGHTVLARPTTPEAALALTTGLVPDVFITDLRFGALVGAEMVESVHVAAPHVPILVLTADDDARALRDALQRGADAVALKMDGIEEIDQILYRISSGSYIARRASGTAEKVWSQQAKRMVKRQSRLRSSQVLTDREQQAMVLLARGESTAATARTMGVSVPTVRTHLHHMYIKLNVHSRVELVAYAVREGIVHVDQTSSVQSAANPGALAS